MTLHDIKNNKKIKFKDFSELKQLVKGEYDVSHDDESDEVTLSNGSEVKYIVSDDDETTTNN